MDVAKLTIVRKTRQSHSHQGPWLGQGGGDLEVFSLCFVVQHHHRSSPLPLYTTPANPQETEEYTQGQCATMMPPAFFSKSYK